MIARTGFDRDKARDVLSNAIFEVYIGAGNWWGVADIVLAIGWGWLGVWAIVWRWRSDVQFGRLDGEAKAWAEIRREFR